MGMTRREWIAGALASGIASCAPPATRRPQDTVTILYPDSDTESVLGPYEDTPAQFLVFMPLVTWNRRGELEPRLAESWQYSSDHRSCTIRLRDDIRWHDGVPVTAHDMKFTLDLLQHPDTDIFLPVSYTVDVLDERTYRIAYHRKSATDGGAVNDWTVCWPKHRLEGLDPKKINSWSFWSEPVGNGPYRHVRTVPQTMMEFVANKDFYRGEPKIKKVALKFGGGSAILEMLSGNVDAVAYSKNKDVFALTRNRRFQAYQQARRTGPALWWNHRHFLFENAAVRRALTCAINRRELFQVIDLPQDVPLMDYVVTERQLRRGEFPAPIEYDPELARRLLDESGWRMRPGKSLRERDGKAFRFKVLTLTAFGDTAEAAVYVQDQLKRVGVHMEIDATSDQPTVKSRIQAGEFEAGLMILGGGLLTTYLRSATGYSNPSYFGLLEETQTIFDPEQMDRVYTEVHRIFQADMPATLLFPFTSTTIAGTRIRGLDDSPYRGDLTMCMDELFLAEEKA